MRNISERAQILLSRLRDCARNLVGRNLTSYDSIVELENDIRILGASYHLVRRLPEWFCSASPSTDASSCGVGRALSEPATCNRNALQVATSIRESIDEAFAMASSLRAYDLAGAIAHNTAWEGAYRRLVAHISTYCECNPQCTDNAESRVSVHLAHGLEQERQAMAHAPVAIQTLRDILMME